MHHRASMLHCYHMDGRVSGLDSYMGSGDRSGSVSTPGSDVDKVASARTVQERLQAAKLARAKTVHTKKPGVKGPSPIKEILKQKKAKKINKAGLMEALNDLQGSGVAGTSKEQIGEEFQKQEDCSHDQEKPGNLTGAFWDESLDVSLLSQGEHHFDVLIKENPELVPWRATFVYGEPRVENRYKMWDLIRSLCGIWSGPWMLMEDFNEAMWQHEHFSETPRADRQVMDFREAHSHCDLHDLGFSGLPWTYNNNQARRCNVRVCLDRGVANTDWSLMFPGANIQHLCTTKSDDKALLFSPSCPEDRARGGSGFRYEIMWERDANLGTEIEKAWLWRNQGSDLGVLADNLKEMASSLKAWSRENVGHVSREIERLRSVLDQLEGDDVVGNRAEILQVKMNLDELLYREEMMWLQRSRINWLKEETETLDTSTAKQDGGPKRTESVS
jgi:hypothetical protein